VHLPICNAWLSLFPSSQAINKTLDQRVRSHPLTVASEFCSSMHRNQVSRMLLALVQVLLHSKVLSDCQTLEALWEMALAMSARLDPIHMNGDISQRRALS
jgi:hypothetical protein